MNARKLDPSTGKPADKKPDPIARARALVSEGDAPRTEPDRRALEAYAAWLFFERRLLCLQLWPQLGGRSDGFVLAGNAGFNWHTEDWSDPAHASRRDPTSRAAAVLDLVGVDWASRSQSDKDLIEIPDTGERPPLPEGWPAADAELFALVKAFVEADTEYNTIIASVDYDEDDPRLPEIDERRDDLIEEVIRIPARTVEGLYAKCEVIARIVDLNPAGTMVSHDASPEDRLAWSLRDDILCIPQEPRFAPRHLPIPIAEAARQLVHELREMRSPLTCFRGKLYETHQVDPEFQRSPAEEARYRALMEDLRVCVGLREEVERIVREEHEAAVAEHRARQSKPTAGDA